MSEFNPEDGKLVTLARAARARVGAAEGAAVRDVDGRTFAAVTVTLPSLSLSALEAAVAAAVAEAVVTHGSTRRAARAHRARPLADAIARAIRLGLAELAHGVAARSRRRAVAELAELVRAKA